MLEGGTVGFIAGQRDFHQGLAVIMPADPSWPSLREPYFKWAMVTRGVPGDPHYFH